MIVLTRVALVAGFGQFYAKLHVSFGHVDIYVTELVLCAAVIASLGPLLAMKLDHMSRLVILFLTFGIGWAVLTGLGDAGTKAFSFFVYSAFYFVIRATVTNEHDRLLFLKTIVLASVVGALIGLHNINAGTLSLADENYVADEWTTTTGSLRWLPGEYALYGMLGVTIVAIRQLLRPGNTYAAWLL